MRHVPPAPLVASVKQLHLFPPNYTAINRAFKVRGKGVWFCYGDTIYNPSRLKIPPSIMAHETVHMHQQGDDPAKWWTDYIRDREFRLHQEIPAHCAEYRWFKNNGMAAPLGMIATRLASPLYGNLIDFETALRLIEDSASEVSTTANGNAWLRNSAAAAM